MGKQSKQTKVDSNQPQSATKEEEPLKAVIIANDQDLSHFISVINSRTRVSLSLLPLVDASIIAYQLEALSNSGVEETIILSDVSITPLKDWIKTKAKVHNVQNDAYFEYGGMKVRIIQGLNWHSQGDAIRELESRDALRPRHDFILIHPGSIFNIDLRNILQEHKDRRATDKSWLMTSLFRLGGSLKTAETSLSIGVDAVTGQLAHYAEINSQEKDLKIDIINGFSNGQRKDLMFLSDVMDCGIDICSPDIMVEFRENFDYEKLRDYVRGKLEGGEAEVLGNRICARLIGFSPYEYAARISSLETLLMSSKDILRRWMYPFTPESNMFGNTTYVLGKYGIYKEKDVLINSANVVVEGDCLLSSKSSFGTSCTISSSLIGANSSIGDSTLIADSIVLNNVTVASNSKITGSLIGSGCKILSNVIIPEGCIIGAGCVIGPSITVKPGSWISVISHDESEKFSEESEKYDSDMDLRSECSVKSINNPSDITWDVNEVGEEGIGKIFLIYDPPKGISDVDSDTSEEFISAPENADLLQDPMKEDSEEENEADSAWRHEIMDTIQRAINEKHDIDNTFLEINSVKLAYDRSSADCAEAIAQSLYIPIESLGDQKSIIKLVQDITSEWAELIQKFCTRDLEQSKFLSGLASFFEMRGKLQGSFLFTLKNLYDNDLIEEETILDWVSSAKIECSVERSRLLTEIEPFLSWLEEADEESDESE